MMGSDRVLNEGDVAAALAAHGFGAERPATGAVVLALSDPLSIVWANASATRLLGTDDPDALFAHVFAGHGRDGLTAAVRRLVPGGGPRSERLRLFRGFRTRTLAVSLSRTQLAGGDDVIVLAIPVAEPDASAGGFAVSALRAPAATAAAAPDPDPEPSPPASAQPSLDPVMATPAGRGPGAPCRFVWHTDADGRLTAVSGAPAALAGLSDAVWADRSAAALAAVLDSDGAGGFAAAVQRQRAWSGLRLHWPLAGGDGRVPVLAGAVPIRASGGGFAGLRGFGVIDVADLPARPDVEVPHEAPVVPADPMASDAVPPDSAKLAAPTVIDVTAPAGAIAAEAAPPRSDPVLPAEPRGGAVTSSKVVALRPFQALASSAGEGTTPLAGRRRDDAAAPVEPAAPAPAADPSNLSSSEHSNFREIGRTLKNGLEADGAVAAGASQGADQAAAMLAALPVAALVAIDGRLAFANAAFLALSGYPSAAALDQAGGLPQLLGGLDPAQIMDVRDERAFPIIDPIGQVIAVEGRAADVPWGPGRAKALLLRAAEARVDETEGLAVELKRRSADVAEARALLDRVSDAVATIDGQGRVLTLNRTAEALFGLPAGGAVGESIGTLLSPEAQSAALGAVLAANAAGPEADPAVIAVSGRKPGGGRLSLSLAARALGAGKVGVVLRDRSDDERLRRDLHRLQAELDLSAGTRSDVLARVSHEIRTPLNAILGFAEIILDERFGPLGNERYKDYLADIRAAGQHAIDFLGDLVDLSKMQAGRVDLAVAPVDVNRIVGETVGEMQGHAHRDRIIVRLSLLPHLPSALVDEKALRQIVTNLLSNAIGFNEPGGQVIVSTAVAEGGTVALRVRDTGVGMSEAELAIMMEPFRQIAMARPASGAGLGLPLTRALVEANQATMSIRSRKGEGTFVEVTFREAKPAERDVPAA